MLPCGVRKLVRCWNLSGVQRERICAPQSEFLRANAQWMIACDFCTVETLRLGRVGCINTIVLQTRHCWQRANRPVRPQPDSAQHVIRDLVPAGSSHGAGGVLRPAAPRQFVSSNVFQEPLPCGPAGDRR
jgi:hypothetical protein